MSTPNEQATLDVAGLIVDSVAVSEALPVGDFVMTQRFLHRSGR